MSSTQVRFSEGRATYESLLDFVRGGGFQRVRLHHLDRPGPRTVPVEPSFQLARVKEAPQLQLPEPGARVQNARRGGDHD